MKPNSLFTNLALPDRPKTEPSTPKDEKEQKLVRKSLETQAATKEAWEATRKRAMFGIGVSTASRFEFDIPEHSPSSSLCPANVPYSSGGSGMCVYHGRRRFSSGNLGVKEKVEDEASN
jgi:hypothetical protein